MNFFCTTFAPSRTNIELWCNGNTTDSGPVIPGSSPGSSTKVLVKEAENSLRSYDFKEFCAFVFSRDYLRNKHLSAREDSKRQ